MKRRKINFDKYLIVQGDLAQTVAAMKELMDLSSLIKKEFKVQKKVQDIVNLPNWLDEKKHTIKVDEFKELRITNLTFCYKNSIIPAIEFDEQEMLFERGKTYGIVGQNLSGKSTLTHLICKLYEHSGGDILLNGIPYEHISRKCIREMVSYASQNVFLFPGTIRDNIKIGNPDATEKEGIKKKIIIFYNIII